MAGNRITVKLAGMPDDNGKIRADAFIDELTAIATALRKTIRLVDHDEEKVVIRISYLRQNSPVEVTLELQSESGVEAAIIDKFSNSLRSINDKFEIPPDFDEELLQSYHNIGKRFGNGISNMVFYNGQAPIEVTAHYSATLTTEIIKRTKHDQYAFGSVIGRLEQANVHSTSKCTIYPFIGRKIACEFDPSLKAEIKNAFDQKVRAFGKLTFKGGQNFPTYLIINRIEILRNDEELPRLGEFKGKAPDATGEQTTDDFINSRRESWDAD